MTDIALLTKTGGVDMPETDFKTKGGVGHGPTDCEIEPEVKGDESDGRMSVTVDTCDQGVKKNVPPLSTGGDSSENKSFSVSSSHEVSPAYAIQESDDESNGGQTPRPQQSYPSRPSEDSSGDKKKESGDIHKPTAIEQNVELKEKPFEVVRADERTTEHRVEHPVKESAYQDGSVHEDEEAKLDEIQMRKKLAAPLISKPMLASSGKASSGGTSPLTGTELDETDASELNVHMKVGEPVIEKRERRERQDNAAVKKKKKKKKKKSSKTPKKADIHRRHPIPPPLPIASFDCWLKNQTTDLGLKAFRTAVNRVLASKKLVPPMGSCSIFVTPKAFDRALRTARIRGTQPSAELACKRLEKFHHNVVTMSYIDYKLKSQESASKKRKARWNSGVILVKERHVRLAAVQVAREDREEGDADTDDDDDEVEGNEAGEWFGGRLHCPQCQSHFAMPATRTLWQHAMEWDRRRVPSVKDDADWFRVKAPCPRCFQCTMLLTVSFMRLYDMLLKEETG